MLPRRGAPFATVARAVESRWTRGGGVLVFAWSDARPSWNRGVRRPPLDAIGFDACAPRPVSRSDRGTCSSCGMSRPLMFKQRLPARMRGVLARHAVISTWLAFVLITASAVVVRRTVGAPLSTTAEGFGVGIDPVSVAVGDLNHDGIADLVTANRGSNTVSVLLGNGDGSFGAKQDFETDTAPSSVAIGDLDGDGTSDLAVAEQGSNTVSVLIGNGDGTFWWYGFSVGESPRSVAIGDLDGDGAPDLVVANQGSNTVSVLLGSGYGDFGAKTDFATGSEPTSVAIGDLNGDGAPDVAVANLGSGTVSVLLGSSDGTFGAKTDFATGSDPLSIVVGDLNGDGAPDLVVGNVNSGTLSVHLGHGDGSFDAESECPFDGWLAEMGSGAVAISDLNGDGKPDLAVANTYSMVYPMGFSGVVSVRLGNGDGTFGVMRRFAGACRLCGADTPASLAVGDLNADGNLDLVVANECPGCRNYQGTVSVLPGNGDGSFDSWSLGVETAAPGLPRNFQLAAPSPNPSRGAAEIHYLVPSECTVDVALFDLAGRKVRSLVADERSKPGEHSIRWDGRDGSGTPVGSGVYLLQVRAGRDVGARRFVILR
jgi:hypothetical protein